MTIGKRIKEERLAKKWTQEQLAVKLNVSRSTVSSWEVERNYPDLETIIAISDLFGQSLDQLLREDPEMITKIKEQATDFIFRKYNWDFVTKETMNLYRR